MELLSHNSNRKAIRQVTCKFCKIAMDKDVIYNHYLTHSEMVID